MKDTEDNPWIKVSDRLPTREELYCAKPGQEGVVLWCGVDDSPVFMYVCSLIGRSKSATHWKRLIPPPQPTAEGLEREAFEEWAKINRLYSLTRSASGGYYANGFAQEAWIGWQARAKKGALGE